MKRLMKRHQPKHIYLDNRIYFITSHIQNNTFLLDNDFKKDKLLLKIFTFAWEFGANLKAWAILFTHFHILFEISDGHNISDFMGKVHGGFALEMNQSEGKKGRSIWQNYWIWIVRDEADYWRHFNYIHNNPIKHGIVHDLRALQKYRYSSYWNYLRIKGADWLTGTMEAYPVIDFTVENDR